MKLKMCELAYTANVVRKKNYVEKRRKRPRKYNSKLFQPSGWLVGCFGFNGPLRQYFSLYRTISQREGEKGEKRIDESKNVQTTPTRTYYKCSRPLPYCNPNCRTPRHWKFTQHHRTTRPPLQPSRWSGGAKVLGKLHVPGRPTIWITVGQGPIAHVVGTGGRLFGNFYSYLFFLSSFSLSFGNGPI